MEHPYADSRCGNNPQALGKIFYYHGTNNAVKQDSHAGERFLDLDPNTKYCLVDTMVLLPLRRGDPDVTRDIKTELNGATLVLLNRIVGEATNKHNELETGDDEMKYMDFVLSLATQLKSTGIAAKFVWFDYRMSRFWALLVDGRVHPSLSPVDYALLCAAVERPDMDVMTDDKALAGSIRQDRGPKARGRVRSATVNYCKRRWDTVGFIRYMLRGHLSKYTRGNWVDRGTHTEFLLNGAVVVSMDHDQRGGARVSPLSCIRNPAVHAALQSKIAKEAKEFFARWRPSRKKKGADKGKNWYKQHLDDDEVWGLR